MMHGSRKHRIHVLFSAVLLKTAVLMLSCGCAAGKEDPRSVKYGDMEAAFEQSGLRSANIGIFTKTEQDGSVSYGECGSGVIYKRDGNDYCALTGAHVVSAQNAGLLVFTVNTEMKTDDIPGVGYSVLSQEAYDAMYPAEILHVSGRDDLAVIRFCAEEDLSAIGLAETDPAKEDRILCVGNPENEWFTVSYGKVTSGMEKFGGAHGFPSNALRHSAYIQVGSSGGAAINEKMKLAGITPGASISPNGKTFYYGVLIPVSEIRLCFADWGMQ